MTSSHHNAGISPTPYKDIRNYFLEFLADKAKGHKPKIAEESVVHVASMTAQQMSNSSFLAPGEEGRYGLTLAEIYLQATEDKSSLMAHCAALRMVGDKALFITGFFPDSLTRSGVDIDYYTGMGCAAYDTLAKVFEERSTTKPHAQAFFGLSQNFLFFADALYESIEHGPADTLRTYDRWLKTGSKQALKTLTDLGITPVAFGGRKPS